MDGERTAGNRKIAIGYGRGLFTQRGGWTIGEFASQTGRKIGSEPLSKVSRRTQTAERTS